MAEKAEIYKCEICGNIVEVLHGGAGELVCCGEAMKKMTEQTADSTTEKHVPVTEESNGEVKIIVGSVPHPMEEKHHIEWIQLVTENHAYRKYLSPGEAPVAAFRTSEKIVCAREFCNIHGLWKG